MLPRPVSGKVMVPTAALCHLCTPPVFTGGSLHSAAGLLLIENLHVLARLTGLELGGRHGLSGGFKRIMRKADLDWETVKSAGVPQLSRRTFHALRHSFTSALANQGVAPELRMKLTGHKTGSIHRGYTHHELEKLRAAVEKTPSPH